MLSTCSCPESKRNCYYHQPQNWGFGRDGFFNNWRCVNWICIWKNADSNLTSCTKVNSRCLEDVLLNENTEEHSDDCGGTTSPFHAERGVSLAGAMEPVGSLGRGWGGGVFSRRRAKLGIPQAVGTQWSLSRPGSCTFGRQGVLLDRSSPEWGGVFGLNYLNLQPGR